MVLLNIFNSIPNATYVGFTGAPIDKTIDVFGEVVDAYTMKESVNDQITVKIVYEGRAAKVLLNPEKFKKLRITMINVLRMEQVNMQ